MSEVRPNWREIPIVDLTDAEVALLSPAEQRWASDLLTQRSIGAPMPEPEPAAPPVVLDFDRPGIAVTETGARIRISPGEAEDDRCFAGELLNPTRRERLGGGHVSCMWDRSKVVRIDPLPNGAKP